MLSRRGTTLAESLVALVFLGVTAGSVLSVVSYCDRQEEYARRREAIMELLRSMIDDSRAAVSGSGLTVGTSTLQESVHGVQGNVTVTYTVANVPGYPSLLEIDVTANWVESFQGGSRPDSMSFSTWVKPNET